MNNIVNNTTTANVINTSDIATNRNIVLWCRRSGNCPRLKLLAAAAMSKDIPVMSAGKPSVWHNVAAAFSVICVWEKIYIPQ